MKRAIVEKIAEATGTAVNRGVALNRLDVVAAGGQPGQAPRSVYRQVNGDWLVDASTVDGQITTYFGHGDAWKGWRTLQDSITSFLRLTSVRASAWHPRGSRKSTEVSMQPPWRLRERCKPGLAPKVLHRSRNTC